jgi:Lon protease-like protein
MIQQTDLIQALTCLVCGNVLKDPITLSCGYTICSHCFPVFNSTTIKKSVFVCPITHCDATTHLFGPELLHDATIIQLTYILQCSNPFPDANSSNKSNDNAMNSIIPFLNCSSCHQTYADPTTTPCGHTFCKLCLLRQKIERTSCLSCSRPLPKYTNLMAQAPNYVLSHILKNLQLAGLIHCDYHETKHLNNLSLQEHDIPLFVSGKIIFPGQRSRLSFYPSSIINLLLSLIPSSRYNNLCLVSVHRSRPAVAQFGTILQVINFEQSGDTVFLDVEATDRFKLEHHKEASHLTADLDILLESDTQKMLEYYNMSSDQEALQTRLIQHTIDLAKTIIQFIKHIGQPSNMSSQVLHAQTAGLLGPLWLENMQKIHGPLPTSDHPAAVCWWAASVLPVPSNSFYTLLRTISLMGRLELVISWMKELESQWKRCREQAIQAMLQVPQQEH